MQTEEQQKNKYNVLGFCTIMFVYIIVMLITLFGGAFAATYYPSLQEAFYKVFGWSTLIVCGVMLSFYVPILIRLNKDRGFRLRAMEGITDFFVEWKTDIKNRKTRKVAIV